MLKFDTSQRTTAMLVKRALPVVLAIVVVGCASVSTRPAQAGPAKPQLTTVTLLISGMT